MTQPAAGRAPHRAILVAGLAAAVLYGISVCPVVFWGDSAELSRNALDPELLPTARGYPLHRLLAHGMGLVAGDTALGANLVSALFGAVTVALVFETARRLGGGVLAGATAAAAMGLAHTFWSYAGIAEVYTLHTAFLAGALLLAVAADAGRPRVLVALGVLLGLSLLHHRMIAFAAPALLWWVVTGAQPGTRLRAAGRVAAGAALGAVPFVVLCLTSSRSPPAGTEDAAAWWIRDVFLGGDRNADLMLGGRKPLAASAAYLGRWLVFNLPGPALLLAAHGFLAGGRRVGVFLALLTLAHAWFPLRYDWTGDQYSFLLPLYPVLGIAAGISAGAIARRAPRVAAVACALVALAPVTLYLVLGTTSLAEKALPRLTPETARATLLPLRAGDTGSREVCARRLRALPPGARLHADWGDGQVYLYLQDAEGLRRDVTVRVWNSSVQLGDGSGEEWLSVLPFTRDLPPAVAALASRLEPRGDGLYRVLPR